MNETAVNRIIEDLMALLPVFHKKLFRMNLDGVAGNLNRHHFAVMGILSEGDATMSDLVKPLAASKSQMTNIINQMVALNIVERSSGTKDRRVIILRLTSHGLSIADEMRHKVIKRTREKLAGLKPDELQEMLSALDSLRKILTII